MVYNFNNLYTDLLHLNNTYENLSIFSIGSSVLGKNLLLHKNRQRHQTDFFERRTPWHGMADRQSPGSIY